MRSYNLTLTDVVLFPARLVKVTRPDGAVYRFAEAETSITVAGDTFTPLPGMKISSVKHVIGGEMPSMEITFAHSDGGTIDSFDLNYGLWDGAEVIVYIVDRNSLSTLGDPHFTGTIQPVSYDIHGGGSFDIRGLAAKAEGVIQTYQAMCRTDLFSSLCQLNKLDHDVAATVASLVDRFNITVTIGSPPADGYFDLGTGETATGLKFEIMRWVQSTATLTMALPICAIGAAGGLQVGGAITLYPGCDKTRPACKTKFITNNIINYQAEPHFLGVNEVVAGG